MRFFKGLICSLLCALLLASVTVSAKEVEYAPYKGYEYNSDSRSVSAPTTYLYDKTIDEKNFGTSLSGPTDFLWHNDKLYILDAGNGRIVVLNSDYSLSSIIENFADAAGTAYTLSEPNGLTIDSSGNIYIADTGNLRIMITDAAGKVIKVIEKPDTKLVGYDFTFDVTKVAVNQQGNLLAVVKSINNGSFAFDKEGNFLYFYGRNTVTKTIDAILNQIRKLYMSQEQLKKIQSIAPAPFTNFDVDSKGFVYTVTETDTSESSPVKKLNFKGSNILKTEGILSSFGDLEYTDTKVLQTQNKTTFIDLDIDDRGFINLLDNGRGRVFQYTDSGQLIAVFGGYGTQYGMVSNPVAIETRGDQIYVLDTNKNAIIEYTPTDYSLLLREAFENLDTSDTEHAIALWEQVLAKNTNSEYPYYGLGMAYEKQGNYKKAMECFKLSDSVSEYSNAYNEYRKQYINDHIGWVIGIIVALIVIIVALIIFKKKRKKEPTVERGYSKLETKKYFAFYTLFHPSDGFSQFKYRNDLASVGISALIVAIFFLVSFLEYFATGYIFNGNDPQDYTVLSTIIGTIGIFVLFVVGNWAVCSLMDGNGKMKEIITVTAYSLLPYIFSKILVIILSNVLTASEGMFLTIISTIGIIWTALILIIGLSSIHQYYIGKTLLTTVISLFAMVIIAIIVFLLFSLMQQIVSFIASIVDEWQLMN